MFATFARDDGTMQVSVNGQPLYTYGADTKPGDTNGQEFGNVWYVVGANGQKIEGSGEAEGASSTELERLRLLGVVEGAGGPAQSRAGALDRDRPCPLVGSAPQWGGLRPVEFAAAPPRRLRRRTALRTSSSRARSGRTDRRARHTSHRDRRAPPAGGGSCLWSDLPLSGAACGRWSSPQLLRCGCAA